MLKHSVFFAACVAAACPAIAEVRVDQSFLVPTTGAGNVVQRVGIVSPPPGPLTAQVTLAAVQTFTAGSTGRLDRLDFQAFRSTPMQQGQLVLSLIEGDYAAGARNVLTSQVTPFDRIGFVNDARSGVTLSFDTSAARFDVAPGTRYSVLFEAFVPPSVNFIGLLTGTASAPVPIGTQPNFYQSNYAGGALYGFTNGVFGTTPSRFDVGFESYVSTAVPEPTSWALMILGFGAAGAALRRRYAFPTTLSGRSLPNTRW